MLLLLVISVFKVNAQGNDFKIDDYVTLEFLSSNDDETHVDVALPGVTNIDNSIGRIVKERMVRVDYLLWNRINIDSLATFLPDSLKVSNGYKKEVNNWRFKKYFNKVVFPSKYSKEEFSESEMMDVASRFFKVVEHKKNVFSRNTCVGSIGFSKNTKSTDVTLLEVVVFDAINSCTEEFIFKNESKYRAIAIHKFSKESSNIKLMKIRNSVFESMKHDKELKKYLLGFINANEKNIPIKIAS